MSPAPSRGQPAAKAQLGGRNHWLPWEHEAASRGVWFAQGTGDDGGALGRKPDPFCSCISQVRGGQGPGPAIPSPAESPLAPSEELNLPLNRQNHTRGTENQNHPLSCRAQRGSLTPCSSKAAPTALLRHSKAGQNQGQAGHCATRDLSCFCSVSPGAGTQ